LRVLAVPGRVPLVPRRFGLIDVPDLQLMQVRRPDLKSVWFGAGLQPWIAHWAVRIAAWSVRSRLVPSLLPFARLMRRTSRWMAGGEPRGGMFVTLTGRDAEGQISKEWVLFAEGDDGPNIPLMASVALIERMISGRRPAPGARPCTDEVSLADFEPLFARFKIATGLWQSRDVSQPLYRKVLGTAYDRLPDPIAALHNVEVDREKTVTGRATVERGTGWLSKLMARFAGLPPASDNEPISVTFRHVNGREIWERRYGSHVMRSALRAGQGKWRHLLIEQFGPIAFGFAVTVDRDGLQLTLRRWSIAGMPLPVWLAPRITAAETGEDGTFHFDVTVSDRLAGPIIRYRGWLNEAEAAD
jgi:hypothetical protein